MSYQEEKDRVLENIAQRAQELSNQGFSWEQAGKQAEKLELKIDEYPIGFNDEPEDELEQIRRRGCYFTDESVGGHQWRW